MPDQLQMTNIEGFIPHNNFITQQKHKEKIVAISEPLHI